MVVNSRVLKQWKVGVFVSLRSCPGSPCLVPIDPDSDKSRSGSTLRPVSPDPNAVVVNDSNTAIQRLDMTRGKARFNYRSRDAMLWTAGRKTMIP